jgi:hypothetical protein
MTMWIVPQKLFIEYTANVPSLVPVTFSGGVFLKDGVALTPRLSGCSTPRD